MSMRVDVSNRGSVAGRDTALLRIPCLPQHIQAVKAAELTSQDIKDVRRTLRSQMKVRQLRFTASLIGLHLHCLLTDTHL